MLKLTLAYERGQRDYSVKSKTGLTPEAVGAARLETIGWTIEAQ